MPWKQEDIAKFPLLTDNSPTGQELLQFGKKAFAHYFPEKADLWDEVNPMVRSDFLKTVKAVLQTLRHADSPMIAVPRAFLIEQRKEWLELNDPKDGTDCVTPFDKFFY